MFPPILSIFATIFCTEFEINEVRLRDWTIFNCYPPQTRTLWQPKSSNYLPCLLSMIRMINNEVWSPSIRSNRSAEINEIAICSVLPGVLANRTNSCDRGTHPRFCGRIHDEGSLRWVNNCLSNTSSIFTRRRSEHLVCFPTGAADWRCYKGWS